jgi:phosphoribosyl-dephospho-CoA transferase
VKTSKIFRPHDLLWVSDSDGLRLVDAVPGWIDAAWIARAPAVVRREKTDVPKDIPVGLRGLIRSQRFKGYLDRDAVIRCISPEMLVSNLADAKCLTLQKFPAFNALMALAPILNTTGLIWGPTGGVGFSLASGLPVLHQDSDLDLLVRASSPLDVGILQRLSDLRKMVRCRLDVQIDTGIGGFSLIELERNNREVLLKTDIGPFLTDDPWNLTAWLKLNTD